VRSGVCHNEAEAIVKYNRTFEELEKKAIKWWPKELETTVAEASVIPKLIATHEQLNA